MDNPYEVVPAPSFGAQPQQAGQGGQSNAQSFGNGLGAALNQMFGNPLKQSPAAPQNNGQAPQQQSPPSQQLGQGAGQGLAAVLKRMFGQNIPSQGQQPGQPPLNIVPDAVDQYGMQKGPITPTQNANQPISNFNPNTTGSLY